MVGPWGGRSLSPRLLLRRASLGSWSLPLLGRFAHVLAVAGSQVGLATPLAPVGAPDPLPVRVHAAPETVVSHERLPGEDGHGSELLACVRPVISVRAALDAGFSAFLREKSGVRRGSWRLPWRCLPEIVRQFSEESGYLCLAVAVGSVELWKR